LLQCASGAGDAPLVEFILQRLPDGARSQVVAATDSAGRTALHWAAKLHHPNVLHALLDAGAPLHKRDEFGFSPLDSATLTLTDPNPAQIECVQKLLAAGADPFAPGPAGLTPVMRLLQWPDNEQTRRVVQGIDFSVCPDINSADGAGWTVAHHTAASGHVAWLPLLHAVEGVDWWAMSVKHRTPAEVAQRCSNTSFTVPEHAVPHWSVCSLSSESSPTPTRPATPIDAGRSIAAQSGAGVARA